MPRIRVNAERLRQAQLDLLLSQGELAARAGISEAFVSRILAGRRGVSPQTLKQLASAAGIHTSALVADGTDTAEDAA